MLILFIVQTGLSYCQDNRTGEAGDPIPIWILDDHPDTEKILNDLEVDSISLPHNIKSLKADGGDLMVVAVRQIKAGDYRRALHFIREALTVFEEKGYQKGRGNALFLIGWIEEDQGNYASGTDHFRQSSEIYGANGHEPELSYALKKLGDTYTKLEEHRLALKHYLEGLCILPDTGYEKQVAGLLLDVGKTYHELGDREVALGYLYQALSLNRESNNQRLIARAHHQIGSIHLDRAVYDSALTYFEAAFQLAHESGHLDEIKASAQKLSNLHEDQGDHEKALDYYKVLRRVNDSLLLKKIHIQVTQLKNDHQFEMELAQYRHLLRREHHLLILSYCGLIFAFLFIFILGRYYYQKKIVLTSLRKKNKEILTTRNQLIVQEKLAALGQLAAGIAHEIKNPLNFVINFAESSVELVNELNEILKPQYLQLPADDLDNVAGIIEDLRQNSIDINRNGHRADRIVRSIMDHARGNRGKVRSTNIHNLIDENVSLAFHGYRAIDTSFDLNVEKNYLPNDILIEINPQDVSRVILNIVNNACYALNKKRKMSPHVFSPLLTIKTSIKNEKCEIRIRDNGPGIPGEIRNKIFNPFFTTKPAGNTGLGLSISYDIVVNGHGGTLEVQSEPDQFTEFIICLPHAKVVPDPEQPKN